jgi:ubiquinone biosynthesis protein
VEKFFRLALRTFQLVGTISRFFLFYFLIPGNRRLPWFVRFRLALEHLGTAWTKLGQALALRFDLLPAEACRELLLIQNEVLPIDYRLIRQVIADELGKFPEEIFERFDSKPFASTSTGQLHKGVTRNGTPIVVKIQGPLIRETFALEGRLMNLVAIPLDWLNIFGPGAARRIVAEFAKKL